MPVSPNVGKDNCPVPITASGMPPLSRKVSPEPRSPATPPPTVKMLLVVGGVRLPLPPQAASANTASRATPRVGHERVVRIMVVCIVFPCSHERATLSAPFHPSARGTVAVSLPEPCPCVTAPNGHSLRAALTVNGLPKLTTDCLTAGGHSKPGQYSMSVHS